MKLNYKYLPVLIFPIFFMKNLFGAYSGLKTLSTKQNIHQIRFISRDGKYTYYQKNDGSLILSHNYSLKTVLKGPIGSQFFIHSSPSRKKLLITMNPFYFNENSLSSSQMVYQIPFGSSNPTPVGKGKVPKLHLNDIWASLYNSFKKQIHFYSLERKNSFTIKINSHTNPYFIPFVVMISNQEILYTDINKKGEQGIFLLDRNLKISKLIYASHYPGVKIELCLKNNTLFLGEFPYPEIDQSSTIKIINLSKERDFKKLKEVYSSKSPDFGNMICETKGDYLYFLKTTSGQELPIGAKTDVHKLNIKDKKITKVSDLNYVTQIYNLDGIILAPYRGDFFVIEGESQLDQDQLAKKGKKE